MHALKGTPPSGHTPSQVELISCDPPGTVAPPSLRRPPASPTPPTVNLVSDLGFRVSAPCCTLNIQEGGECLYLGTTSLTPPTTGSPIEPGHPCSARQDNREETEPPTRGRTRDTNRLWASDSARMVMHVLPPALSHAQASPDLSSIAAPSRSTARNSPPDQYPPLTRTPHIRVTPPPPTPSTTSPPRVPEASPIHDERSADSASFLRRYTSAPYSPEAAIKNESKRLVRRREYDRSRGCVLITRVTFRVRVHV